MGTEISKLRYAVGNMKLLQSILLAFNITCSLGAPIIPTVLTQDESGNFLLDLGNEILTISDPSQLELYLQAFGADLADPLPPAQILKPKKVASLKEQAPVQLMTHDFQPARDLVLDPVLPSVPEQVPEAAPAVPEIAQSVPQEEAMSEIRQPVSEVAPEIAPAVAVFHPESAARPVIGETETILSTGKVIPMPSQLEAESPSDVAHEFFVPPEILLAKQSHWKTNDHLDHGKFEELPSKK